MSKLTDLTLTDALSGLKNKEFSAAELTHAYIDMMKSHRDLNAYITETPDLALLQAAQSDDRISKGDAKPLDGIPLAIKDLYCTKGVRSTASSKMLENFVPTYESTVSHNLLNDGTVTLGKTSMDEFAMGSSNTTSYFGDVISPWKNQSDPSLNLVPGGSSGGSASAVAARMCLGATGSDTGGSIRQPASFCGIAGIKPTYGRCSRWGMIAFASSLDQAGPMARTTEDCAHMLKSMAGHDPKDSTSANREVPDFVGALTPNIKGLKVGIPKEYRIDDMPTEIAKLWDDGIAWMKDAGAEIVEISLPHTKYGLPTYYILASAECSSNLARYDGVKYGLRMEGETLNDMYELSRAEGFGEEVKRRILLGTYVLSAGYYDAYYIKAQKVRRLIKQDFTNAYEQCDVILTPTAPSGAFAIGEKQDDPIKMYLNDVFTVSTNLAGLPGMSVPAGLDSNGLPLGLQIIGKSWDEQTVLNAGLAIEKAANFSAIPNLLNAKAA